LNQALVLWKKNLPGPGLTKFKKHCPSIYLRTERLWQFQSKCPVHYGHHGHSNHEPTRYAVMARISIITQRSRASELLEVCPRVCSVFSMLWTNAPLHSYVTTRCHDNPNITRLFGCALHATPLPVLWRYLVSGWDTNKIYRWLPLSRARHYMQLRFCPMTPRHKPVDWYIMKHLNDTDPRV